MSFREKSAWIMAVTVLLGGLYYFWVVFEMSAALGAVAPPVLPVVFVYVVALTILAIFGHVIVAMLAPKDANAAFDERDRAIERRATGIAGPIMTTGVVTMLGFYLFSYSGNVLFHGVLLSLMVAQLAEYLAQIYFYRRAV